MTLRVTHRGLYTGSLANLQTNLSRVQEVQEQLSSGKIIDQPSDSPSGAGAALKHRQDISRGEQLVRNADDGLGWLATADSAITEGLTMMNRMRELMVQGNNSVIGDTARNAIAAEIEGLRDALLNTANTRYLDRPVFSGTADVADAYDATGAFQGDAGIVQRSLRPGVAVKVNVTGEAVYGPAGADIFATLTDIADHLRTDPSQLTADLATFDGHFDRMQNAIAEVGARYNQVETLRSKSEEDILISKNSLSEIEDVDFPATIVEMQLRETAYQAALSATSRAIQPSLLDFLR